MGAYRTVLVGTDGSDTSLHAVDRAGGLAAESGAKLIIATGYLTHEDDTRAADVLKDEGYMVRGKAPIYANLRRARVRAAAAGATDIEERSIEGAPVQALVNLAEEVHADLLVVGDVGLHARRAILARLFTVPGAVAIRAKSDVLIVHTSD
ncbi:universal stress protein [Mycolicibacterium thermoresistibile]